MTAEYIAVPAEADELEQRITTGKQTVLTELQRADGKATSLLGLFGVVLAGVVALTRTGMSTPALVLLHLAALPTAAAVVLLLWVIRPNLGGGTRAGFTRWAKFTAAPERLTVDLDRDQDQTTEDDAHHLAVLSALAVAKYERIAYAIYLLVTGLAITALAVLAA